jgi:hypothetical protein
MLIPVLKRNGRGKMTVKSMSIATCDECGAQLQTEKGSVGLDALFQREGWLAVHWSEAEVRGLRNDGLHSHYCRKCRKVMEKKMPGLGTSYEMSEGEKRAAIDRAINDGK